MFINYIVNEGLSINSFRKPNAAAGDVTDLIAAMSVGAANIVCDLDGAKDALEDGSLWTDEDQATIEVLHSFLSDQECL